MSTMSVVGLTLGRGAKAIRPSAARAASVATSASTRDVGCVRSYQPKPAPSARTRTSEDAAIQLTRPPPGSRRAPGAAAGPPRGGAGGAGEPRGALLGGQRARAEHARDLRREVPAAAEHLGGRRVGH